MDEENNLLTFAEMEELVGKGEKWARTLRTRQWPATGRKRLTVSSNVDLLKVILREVTGYDDVPEQTRYELEVKVGTSTLGKCEARPHEEKYASLKQMFEAKYAQSCHSGGRPNEQIREQAARHLEIGLEYARGLLG